ncbi:hypothetical protein OBBRIDRAFT_837161 [Obba rivulosa]|uniref:Transforming growth factor beta regulator 1 n=1 Tax=Obba rivulosa TaxID=1052685 RepID=A0A8E2DI83_9APHY|nr:hypothetical protein OBBRIDRAFT_837161 [Obba rivulosa]
MSHPPPDVVMGPPPLPPHASSQQKPRDSQDVGEKYSKLKRKYFELEEKHKDTLHQLRASAERNVKWRAERELLLNRIAELETNPNHNPTAQIPAPPFTAFPRSLLSPYGQKMFVQNLRQAIDELEMEDPEVDPVLLSRHIGPEARKRQEAEMKERQEEEAREQRRASRRTRGGPQKKDVSTPLTFAPAQPPPPGQNMSSPVLVVSGTRLRLKPPAPPQSGEVGPTAPPPGAHGQVPHSTAAMHAPRSESPISPMATPDNEYPPPGAGGALSPSMAYTQQHTMAVQPQPHAAQGQMQMTLRAPPSTSRPSEIQRHAKPKRLKAHTVTTKSYSIPTVPRDRKGRAVLPLTVGIMTVLNLGEVCTREHFHTERYIFPVGYEVTRRYLSMTDPNAEVTYHCTILDGGDGPKFQIVPSDDPTKTIIAGTATGAWSVIVRAANQVRNRQHSNSVSGPDFFGLGQNTIKHLLQELPNAEKLKNYVWQHFVEGGPLGGRHAAVIPALPEDQEGGAPTSSGYYAERNGMDVDQRGPRELQIIRVDTEDTAHVRLASGAVKPLLFQQEYPQEYARSAEHEREREHEPRASRRSSRGGPSAYDEYAERASPPPQHRPPSHSPSLAREHYTHTPPQHGRAHGQSPPMHHHSPYQAPNGSASSPPPPPVPPTFASIMNAYPAAPHGASSPGGPEGPEYAYSNGSARRNGRSSYPPGERAER